MSESDSAQCAPIKDKHAVESAMQKMLARSLADRVLHSYRMDLKILTELLLAGRIREIVGDTWTALLVRKIDTLNNSPALAAAVEEAELTLLGETKQVTVGDAGTPFAISNSNSKG